MKAASKSWTTKELERLKKLSKETTTNKIAEIMGKTRGEVRYQLGKQQLSVTVPWKRTFSEVSQIYNHSERNGIKASAKHFNLSIDVIKNVRRVYLKQLKSRAEALNSESLQKLRAKAMWVANKKGFGNHAEDFASEVVIQAISSGRTNLEWLWVDYTRTHFAYFRDTNGSGPSERSQNEASAKLYYSKIVEDFDDSGGVQVEGGMDTPEPATLRLVEELGMEGRDRIILVLYTHFGLHQKEIGQVLGVSESRVTQELGRITAHVRKRYLQDESE